MNYSLRHRAEQEVTDRPVAMASRHDHVDILLVGDPQDGVHRAVVGDDAGSALGRCSQPDEAGVEALPGDVILFIDEIRRDNLRKSEAGTEGDDIRSNMEKYDLAIEFESDAIGKLQCRGRGFTE